MARVVLAGLKQLDCGSELYGCYHYASAEVASWISFARTGTPSSDRLPEWTPYDTDTRTLMRFDVVPSLVDDPEKGIREILSQENN